MKNIYIIVLSLTFITVLSQNKTVIKRSYEISICGKPQKIILTESTNGDFEGNIETELTKKGKFGKSKRILDKKSIKKETVEKLMFKLKENGIETLINCDEDEECKKIGFLDGDYVGFNISDGDINKKKSFQEIYPESQSKELEKVELRRKAQVLLTIIDSDLNLKKLFFDLIKSFKNGMYCYWSGTTESCINKRK